MLDAPTLKRKIQVGEAKQLRISFLVEPDQQARPEEDITTGNLRLHWHLAPASGGKMRVLRSQWVNEDK